MPHEPTGSFPTANSRTEGFTLIELLVVLGIIALLATLVAPRVVGYLSKAKSDPAVAQLHNLGGTVGAMRA